MGLLSAVGGLFNSPGESPNALQRFGMALNDDKSAMEIANNTRLGQIAQGGDPIKMLQDAAAIDPKYLPALATVLEANRKAAAPDWTFEKTDDGSIIRFDKNNPNTPASMVYRGKPAAPDDGLTPTQRLERDEGMEQLDRGIASVEALQQRIKDDPSLGGVVGSARSGVETLTGSLKDISGVLPIPGLESIMEKIDSATRLGDDQSAKALDAIENDLAYGLARARKGSGRLNVDDVKAARADVKIRGLQSSDQVISKLDTVKKQMIEQRNLGAGRLGRSLVSPNTAETKKRRRWNPATGKLE